MRLMINRHLAQGLRAGEANKVCSVTWVGGGEWRYYVGGHGVVRQE